ncbi:MAG: chromosome segregation protein SMC [Clostridiales bacterium]|nr:chromosome segregation protein SMC [Clostridiales bacterium]
MILKSLEIQGFKTFPDKTKLTFDRGITSVVGPNGSGKSNISDAIRWVLGEQSTKSLRCAKMEDVIFKGTDNRKKNGFAEVTLTIENSDRVLPYDDNEVSVTRRFYRSGESEYLINKATVRLKDIHELFMDTGLGRDGYSMISQGKIDSIVSSKSEERREIFEEAAGISRYRYRKTEAERRLKSTEENLYRLRDILTELEDRVGPLKVQSEKAVKFLDYSKEKRGLEIGIWLDTINKSENRLREQEDKLLTASAEYDSYGIELENAAKKGEELYNLSYQKNLDNESVREQIAQADREITLLNEKSAVEKNDIIHNEENIKRLESEIEFTLQSAAALSNLRLEKQKQIEEKRELAVKMLASYAEKAKNLNVINENELKYSDKTQKLTAKLAQLNSKCAEARIKEMTASGSLGEIGERLVNIRASEDDAKKAIAKLEEYTEQLKEHSEKCAEQIESSSQSLEGCKMLYENRLEKAEKAKRESERLNLDAKEYERRMRILEDLEKNLEGFSNSVKSVMKEASHSTLWGIIGPVSKIITVESEYAIAIETALGAAMQNIVCNDEKSAKSAIAFLKRTNGGRATFLPLTNIKGNVINENGLQSCAGYVDIASRLCGFDGKYKNIVENLLGRTIIAEDINFAAEIAKKYNYKYKIVTLDGQVVNAGGSFTGGSFGKKSGVLSRAGDIKRYKERAEQLAKESLDMLAEYKEHYKKAEKIRADMLIYESQISNSREDKIKFDTERDAKLAELENSRRALKLMLDEEATSSARTKEFSNQRDNAHRLVEEISAQIIETEADIALITGDKEQISKNRQELNEELEKMRLSAALNEKEIETLAADAQKAELSEQEQRGRREQLLFEIENIKNSNEEKQKSIETTKLLTEEKEALREALKQKIESTNAERMQLEKEISAARNSEREIQNKREILGRELARLEEQKLNLQKKYDDIIAKLWEEYELTKNEAQREQIDIEDISAANKRLNELKGKIKALGNINVGAIEEYKEVNERYTFMSAQVSDVEKSKADIEKLISELVKQMTVTFVQRFKEINENFNSTFKELFGGGKAALELTAPDDILNSGIDIICNPPGKIVEHLELLSGGEKALVAIALYFAIMKVSPAPFCVMDEIEAALDDVNVYRFAAYLRRMNANTQFILITHRRGTMEEADVLYGVTMQDKGISKLLKLETTEIASKLPGIK